MKLVTPEDAMTQHKRAVASLQMAQLKYSNVVSVIERGGKPKSRKQQRSLDRAMDQVQRAQLHLASASQHAFNGATLAPPKGVIVAPSSAHQPRVLYSKPASRADVAATAALPNTLWARVRNFFRAPF